MPNPINHIDRFNTWCLSINSEVGLLQVTLLSDLLVTACREYGGVFKIPAGHHALNRKRLPSTSPSTLVDTAARPKKIATVSTVKKTSSVNW